MKWQNVAEIVYSAKKYASQCDCEAIKDNQWSRVNDVNFEWIRESTLLFYNWRDKRALSDHAQCAKNASGKSSLLGAAVTEAMTRSYQKLHQNQSKGFLGCGSSLAG